MDIPESAREAGISAMHSLPEVYWAREGATVAVEAAAPHIARAAQVQILREKADEIDGKHAIDAADLRAMADELEQESP